MADPRTTLERIGERVAVPEPAFARLVERRRRKRRNQRILSGVVAFAVFGAVAVGFALSQASAPPPPPPASPPDTSIGLRRDGEVILNTGSVWLSGRRGDVLGADPSTGEVRTLVGADEVPGPLDSAAWSGDGRWLGFSIRGCSPGIPNAGLWVMQTPGQAERLTTRTCSDPAAQFAERWAWSPTDARLVIQRHGASGDSLILIDALTGERRDLGRVNGTITSLTWSPDGRLVTYATDPSGSISSVNVDDGVHSLLARSLGYVWGIGDPGIHWSPDGTHILIAAASVDDATPSTFGLYLMDPDGSDLRTISDAGSGFAWSPDGSSIAFASSTKAPGGRRFRIWTMSPEDRVPMLVDDELIALEAHHEVGSPVWSPDGSRIAYRVAALSSDGTDAYFVIDADGTGGARPLDALQYLSWRGGWFHCECYG